MSKVLRDSFFSFLKHRNLEAVGYSKWSDKVQLATGGTSKARVFIEKVLKEVRKTPPENYELSNSLLSTESTKFILGCLSSLPATGSEEAPEWVNGLTLNTDLTNSDNIFLTDEEENPSPYDYRVYLAHVGMSEAQALLSARRVFPRFNPREKRRISTGTIPGYMGEYQIYNTYKDAQWKSLPDLGAPLPELFEKLMTHLVPGKEDREFAYYWIRKSLVDRARTFLILCGPPGVGKNRLKLFMTAAHGASNAVDGKKSTLTTQFNAQLSQGTLLWFDELSYSMDDENVMKEVPNESMSIEHKGIDATRSTELFGSYIISNNKPRDNYLSMDARKFCPVTLNSERLEKSMTWEEINEFSEKCDHHKPTFDPRFVADICYWIINNCDSDKWPVDEYKSKAFHRLTHTSMSMWQKRVVHIIESMEVDGPEYKTDKALKNGFQIFQTKKCGVTDCITLQAMFESLNKYNGSKQVFPEFSTVEAFLTVYRNLDGEKLCEVEELPKNIYGNFSVRRVGGEQPQLNAEDEL